LFFVPTDSTTIYVLATAAICYDTLPIQIFVEDYPDFTLEGQPCDLLQGTYSVLFTSSADSIHASIGTVVNNPTGQDAVTGIPNNTNVTIEILNPTGLCTDTFLIVAPNCNCPMINQPVPGAPAYSLCEDETSPVMSVTVDPGMVANWYTVPSGGVAFLQNSLTYQPASPANATYYVEALDPASNCYSIRTSIGLQVYPLPVLQGQADPVLCAGETIDLTALTPAVLNGVSGTGGWFKLPGNLPASGVVTPLNGDTWQYVFTSNPGNCEDRDTITAIVNPLPALNVYDILCDDQALTFELLFTSTADIIQTNTGTLVQIAGTDSFALQDIAFDTDIQFDLEITATGCTNSILLPAPDCSCPALLQNTVYQLCSDPGTVDLSTFEGPGVNGTWQMVSTPPGANPATLSGSNFDGFQADPGLYTLRFIRSVFLANCVDSALFQLTLRGSPYADAGSNGIVCAPDNIVLTGTAGGTNTVHNWQTSGSGVIANPGALNITYTPTLADITAGSITFTLTSTDQGGVCPAATETVTYTIDGRAYYILNAGTQTYCDTSNTLVDLDALITFGNTGGIWFFPDTVSAPVTGSSQINPSTLAAGSYTIFYTTTNAVAPCENDTTGVNLLIRNCACPSVAISSPLQGLCSEAGTLNLNSLLLTGEPGTWSIVSAPAGTKPAVITGTNFVTNKSDAGTYRIRFTLSNAVAGCPDFSEVNVNVIATPTLAVTAVNCAGDLQTWQATITSSGVPTTSEGNVVSLGGNQYRIENITLNTALQVTVTSGNGLCTTTIDIASADCECTLSVINLPVSVDLCPDESITLQPQVNDPKGSVTSFWIVGNDSLYQNTLQVSQAGSYEFVAEDALGCKENQIVNVSYYQEMIPGVSWVDITCPGDHDGVIAIQGIMGGNGPYFIIVDGGPQQQITAFPYIIDGLGAGTYHLELVDGNNCRTELDVEIKSASSESLSLGPDQTILAGDSVVIKPQLSFTPDTFYWSGDAGQLLQADQLNQVIRPETDQQFQLSGIDAKGCLYTDELKIKVLLNSNIFIANVFSPNGDGVNDVLFPQSDPSITLIQYFEIYSRWGELVYSVHDIAPNQSNLGWDGTLDKERMMPGVYVYRVGATNKRGREFFLTGDVTLLR
jgi:gliding motility-associated-like protein